MRTNACLMYTESARRVPSPQSDSNPASLRVPGSAAPAVARPPPGPRPASGTAGVGRCTGARRWAGRGRQRGPGRGLGRAQRGGPEPAPLAQATGPAAGSGTGHQADPWPQSTRRAVTQGVCKTARRGKVVVSGSGGGRERCLEPPITPPSASRLGKTESSG